MLVGRCSSGLSGHQNLKNHKCRLYLDTRDLLFLFPSSGNFSALGRDRLRLNQRKAVYIHQPKIGDLQMGDDGQGQKSQMQEGLR